jgi:hypothetical protein
MFSMRRLAYPILLFGLCVCMSCSDHGPTAPNQMAPAPKGPHISYYDVTNEDLKYAVKSGAGWTIETVDAAGSVGWFTSLVIDARGNPHISYQEAANGKLKLKYAAKSGTSWSLEIVDATGYVGGYTSIAYDQ